MRIIESAHLFRSMSAAPKEERLSLGWRLREAFIWHQFSVPWNNKWRMRVLSALVPDRLRYWILIQEASATERHSYPGSTPVDAMLKRLERKNKRDWRGWP